MSSGGDYTAREDQFPGSKSRCEGHKIEDLEYE